MNDIIDLSYNEINNVLQSAFLPSVKGLNNTTAFYYRKYLLQKLLSAFKWTIPELWNRDYFLYVLFGYGYIAIIDSGVENYGIIPQRCGIYGYNLFYMPTKVRIHNPLLPNINELTIDQDCTVLRVNPNFSSVLDIVDFYAVKLAMIAGDVESNLINSKLSYLFVAGNQTSATSFKKLYDKISQGEPAVIVDKNLLSEDGKKPWELFQQDLSQNYIVSDLLEDMRKLENDFCTKIGIPVTNSEKKERLSTVEVTRNDVETESLIDTWYQRLSDEVAKTNDLFPGLNLKVEKRWNNESDSFNSWSV